METNKINQIKKEINKIIKKENLVYCDVYYDGECEDKDGVWLYDLIVYDRAEKITALVSKINQYAQTTLYKNMDDGDYTIECVINERISNKDWIDELDDEEDLMCLDWHEYHDREPCFVDKYEIEHIFEEAIKYGNIQANKLTENRYEVTFNGDILYFVCPLNAKKEVKQWWKDLKWLFKEYE